MYYYEPNKPQSLYWQDQNEYRRPPPRQQGQTTTPYAWDTLETESNIKQFKGQYIRIQIPELGRVIAQLLDFDSTTNQVELNVYIEGRSSYMKINQKDLTGLLPLGPQFPYELYMQQQQGGEYPQSSDSRNKDGNL